MTTRRTITPIDLTDGDVKATNSIALTTSLELYSGENRIVTRLADRVVCDWLSAVFTEEGIQNAVESQQERVLDSFAHLLALQVNQDRPTWGKAPEARS